MKTFSQLEQHYADKRKSTTMLTQLANTSEYLRAYGRDIRDFYSTDGTNRRDLAAKWLLPLGWHFYRQDNLDQLLEQIREQINPAVAMDELLELLEYVFHQYQAQIATNPSITLNDEQIATRVQQMNCKVKLMYSRKFKLFLANQFNYQQFRRHPYARLKEGRNLPPVLVEREKRRDQLSNLPQGLPLRQSLRFMEARKTTAAWKVRANQNSANNSNLRRAFEEPSHERYLSNRNKPTVITQRTLPNTFMLRP
jgi:hypothetical protein